MSSDSEVDDPLDYESGNLTKRYNRDKRISEMVKGGEDLRYAPKSNPQMKSSSAEDDLSKYTGRIKLDGDSYFGRGSRSSKLAASANSTDRADRATTEQVLDPRTRMILFKMINRGVVYEVNGCVSTGKEANVYHAETEDGEHRAIKIYKTSILVFKDRDRYVTGEFRFRNGYSRHNPRKMVKVWAEKETRNLKRIYQAGIPVPKPLHLHLHVLVMEFLGDENGWPSPRLKDADIDPDEYPRLYLQLVSYMRLLYHQCRLVHADLSEYNLLYHKNQLYIIDVSQSVEHDHPHSLEFLRMDIKNVNDYFRRQGVTPFAEKILFAFITEPPTGQETSESIIERLEAIPQRELSEKEQMDDVVFRSLYIPQKLNEVWDGVGHVEKSSLGEGEQFVYSQFVNERSKQAQSENADEADEDNEDDQEEEDEEEEDDNEEENSESESESDSDGQDVWEEKPVKPRKFEDREANKARKKELKEQKKEKRKTKMKKNTKKKLVNSSTTKKKK